MSSVPYPSFLQKNPVDTRSNRAALVAVGRCRIYPEISTSHHYRDIVTKNKEQARVALEMENSASNDDNATTGSRGAYGDKLKKKCMKEGVAMAKSYLVESLQLDVSVVDVEVMVKADDICSTDGCLAACLLDAGCDKIVTDGSNIQALDMAKIPRERLVAHFKYDDFIDNAANTKDDFTVSSVNSSLFMNDVTNAAQYASVISVELSNSYDLNETKIMEIGESFLKAVTMTQSTATYTKLVVAFDPKKYGNRRQQEQQSSAAASTYLEDLAAMVGFVCKVGNITISLIDPSANELGLCFAACMKTDRKDELYTTVVCSRNGEALGLVYSSKESLVAALECGRGVYYSRSRNSLWRKGDSSGHYQVLHRLDVDCDGDALRFTVTQCGGDTNPPAFCHLNTLTCWGKPRGLLHLQETLQDRYKNAPENSYTKRLFDDSKLLRDKLVEEAQELSEATTKSHVAEELADVLYFAMVRATAAGVSIEDAVAELDKRSRKVTRRKGDSKAFRIHAASMILDKGKGDSADDNYSGKFDDCSKR